VDPKLEAMAARAADAEATAAAAQALVAERIRSLKDLQTTLQRTIMESRPAQQSSL
jgi:hypothetical protein